MSLTPGVGGETVTDHDGNQREVALVAQAGPAAQILFDDQHGASDAVWVGHRTGMNGHDKQATMKAIRTWLPDPDPAPRIQAFRELERGTRDLVATDDAKRLILKVAMALDEELVLDEDRLRQLLR